MTTIRTFLSASFGATLLVLCACSPSQKLSEPSDELSQIQDGVRVGNGKQFVSEKYKFEVRYNEALQVNPQTQDRLHIESVATLAEPTTIADFHIFENGYIEGIDASDAAKLRRYLEIRHSEMPFKQGKLNGLVWFYHEVQQKETHRGDHYILTPLRDIVYVKLTAAAHGIGFKLLTSLVTSFQFDAVGPQVHSIRMLQPRVHVQDINQVQFHITDNVVGVRREARGKLNAIKPTRTTACDTEISFTTLLESDGKDTYTGAVPANYRLCPGQYGLSEFTIFDKAGNPTSLRTASRRNPDPNGFYLGNGGHKLGVVTFDITPADVADNAPPEFLGFDRQTIEMAAGETQYLYFSAIDKEAGLAQYQSLWGTFFPSVKADNDQIRIPMYGTVRKTTADGVPLKADQYGLAIRPGSSLPPGEYYLAKFSVSDRTGGPLPKAPNQTILEADPRPTKPGESWFYHSKDLKETKKPPTPTRFPVVVLKLTNRGTPDVEPPRVESMECLTKKITAGSKVIFKFAASDAGTGIADYMQFGPLNLVKGGNPIYLGGTVRRLGDGAYTFEFFLDEDTKPGKYALDSFEVYDRAGNRSSWSFGRAGGWWKEFKDNLEKPRFYPNYSVPAGARPGSEPKIAVPIIEVTSPS